MLGLQLYWETGADLGSVICSEATGADLGSVIGAETTGADLGSVILLVLNFATGADWVLFTFPGSGAGTTGADLGPFIFWSNWWIATFYFSWAPTSDLTFFLVPELDAFFLFLFFQGIEQG